MTSYIENLEGRGYRANSYQLLDLLLEHVGYKKEAVEAIIRGARQDCARSAQSKEDLFQQTEKEKVLAAFDPDTGSFSRAGKIMYDNAQSPETPKIGDKMRDGTFYLGRFKSIDGTVKDWFAAADDVRAKNGGRLSMNFNAAVKFAKKSMAHDRSDWMLPPGEDDRVGEPDILNEMYKNRAKIGGFVDEHEKKRSHYWGSYFSSSPHYANIFDAAARKCLMASAVKVQRFTDGAQYFGTKKGGNMEPMYVRLVRSVIVTPPPCGGMAVP